MSNGSTATEGLSGSSRFGVPLVGSAPSSATPVDPHRLSDVLDPLIAHIGEDQVDLALDVIDHRAGQTDAAGLGQPFQACRHVDAVAVEVRAFDHDVAQVDADAQARAPLLGQVAVAPGHGFLDRHRALDGVDHAGELDQRPVAHQLDDAAPVLGDLGRENLLAQRLERAQGAGFVSAHQAAVTDHVGGQYGGKASLQFKAPSPRRLSDPKSGIHGTLGAARPVR